MYETINSSAMNSHLHVYICAYLMTACGYLMSTCDIRMYVIGSKMTSTSDCVSFYRSSCRTVSIQ